eukprot:11766394-Prorocentrum_lima.AAC.1
MDVAGKAHAAVGHVQRDGQGCGCDVRKQAFGNCSDDPAAATQWEPKVEGIHNGLLQDVVVAHCLECSQKQQVLQKW